jgi:N6-adenosine-specific RNA methylase IME4
MTESTGRYPVHPLADIFPPMSEAEYEALKQDIAERGVHEPITLWAGQLVDGRHRLRACEELGIEAPTRAWHGGEDGLAAYVISLNLHRRHLDESQRAMVAARVASLHRGANQHSEGLPIGRASGMLNVSERSAHRARDVIEAGVPELVRAVEGGMVAVSTAATLTALPPERQREVVARGEAEILREAKRIREERAREKDARRHALARTIAAEPQPLPEGPFRVLVIDPPWQYEKRAEDPSHRGRCPYPTMALDDIAALPVSSLAAPDAVLWLWSTNAFMSDAYRLLDGWGFQHKTILTWAKDRMGLGDWLRGQTEHCLLAVRGKPLVTLTNQTTLLRAPVREHSRKPDEFYALVESLCPGGEGRVIRPGSAAWLGTVGRGSASRGSMTAPLIVPLASAAELRFAFAPNGVDLQCWRRQGDRHLMAGGFWCTRDDLRLLRHGIAAAILILNHERKSA